MRRDRAGRRGYEVHAFDPTERFREQHARHRSPGVSFHYLGLGAKGGAAERWAGRQGWNTLGGAVLPLDELQERLGHVRRPIQLLKIDCEGCEWEAFVDLARRRPRVAESVCTLILELHVSANLQMNTSADLGRMAAFWELYVLRLGFRFWYAHANPGGDRDRSVPPALVALGLDPSTAAYEIGLRREAPHCETSGGSPPSR